MRFVPWLIEDSWGYAGVFLTSPILIVLYFLLRRLKTQVPITHFNQAIPLIVAGSSLLIVLMHTTDFLNIVALIVNAGMFVAACVVFIKSLVSN